MEVPTQFCWAGNRGALTTTFTPPSTCLATTSVYLSGYLAPPSVQQTVYYVGWVPIVPDYLPNDVNDPCLPPPTTPLNLAGQAWYYSPGICPSAYTPAVQLLTLPNICDSAAALPESVTAWVCCPPSYSIATSATSNEWLGQSICVTTAQGAATLTSVWPVSWVSANGDFQYSTSGPIIPPSGIMQSIVVITNPIVIAAGIPILWESTDTLVQSWFDHYQSSGALSTTSSNPSHLTTSPPPTQSLAKTTSTSIQTSRASDQGRGNNLSVTALGALLLIGIIILSS